MKVVHVPKNSAGWCQQHLTDSPRVMVACVHCNREMHVHEVDVDRARRKGPVLYRCPHCRMANCIVRGLSGNSMTLGSWDNNAPAFQLTLRMR